MYTPSECDTLKLKNLNLKYLKTLGQSFEGNRELD